MKHNEIDYLNVNTATHPYESFALDDVLQHMVSVDERIKVRTWVHHPFVILGLHDARLPHLEDGLKFLERQHFDYVVRNSGGLGVVLDDGVLNISIILPLKYAPKIDDGYELMFQWVKMTIGEVVRAYEITESYCPGDYDLSIDGKKFAGISQRRIKQGVAVQIYLCVTGSGAERAKLMKEFYQYAKKDTDTKFKYPVIQPDVMASINELTGENYSVDSLNDRMMKSLPKILNNNEPITIHEIEPNDSEFNHDEFHYQMKRMIKRNENIRSMRDTDLFGEYI